jgi:hypothetical protein
VPNALFQGRLDQDGCGRWICASEILAAVVGGFDCRTVGSAPVNAVAPFIINASLSH